MRETTFLLILDACRRDYVTPENAPFLHGLMQRSLTASIESPPGFTQRTTMFTGTFPDTSNAFSAFGYDPDHSPFKWVGKLGPVNRLYQPRKVLFPFRLAVKHISKWTSGQYHTDPAWIPGPYLPHFSVVEDHKPIYEEGAMPLPGIFDLLRAQGKSFKYLAHPISGNDNEIHRMVLDTFRKQEEHAFVFAQFSDLDEGAHHKGPLVPEGYTPAANQTGADRAFMVAQIREIDRKCREIHETLAANYDRFHFLCIGDHGMAPVMQKVNVLAQVESLGLRAGKDYVLFLDSTLAKLWFLNERAEREITELFRDVTYGRIVTAEERRERRIPTDRKYGDLMFAADPGVLFWPDYFHVVEHDIKGMHGYLDKGIHWPPRSGADTWGAETTGVLIMDSPHVGAPRDLGLRNLVDVFPTLCRLAEVEVPRTNEGRSFLEESHALAP
ncbi:MAG TPA: alkaline phosphatase family protein [Candidatus Thermoplasmatota archaeon]|nr:alkaline phosphatase family protein [Candidatus Thermoplasmatota archaeon]